MAQERVIKALGEKFSFTITNSSVTRVVIAILSSFFDVLKSVADVNTYTDPTAIKAAGYDCDVVLSDGIIMPNVTATSGSNKITIRQFQEYLKHYGRTAIDMTIRASHVDCFNETLQVIQHTPLSGSMTSYLDIANLQSVDQIDRLSVVIKDISLAMAFDTLVLLPVGPGRTVTVSFSFS